MLRGKRPILHLPKPKLRQDGIAHKPLYQAGSAPRAPVTSPSDEKFRKVYPK